MLTRMPRAAVVHSLSLLCVTFLLSGCKQPDIDTEAVISEAPKIGFIWTAPVLLPLKSNGYEAKEYFFQGTAKSYVADQPMGSDGKWSVSESGETAAYKSRMIVYRPTDPERFNGTVIVEWMNVSGGLDTPTEWVMLHTELMRQGYAFVGVSAQYMGVEGGPSPIPRQAPLCLSVKCVLPPRYGSLSHPGDSFSYDIFRQAAGLVRYPRELNPLGALVPTHLIVAGQSQSAHRLVTFANAFGLDTTDLIDGYFIHSRLGAGVPELGGGGSAPLSQAPQVDIHPPAAVRIREDLPVPVMNLQAETDQVPLLAHMSRQPDSSVFRLWEVAGSAHADRYVSSTGLSDNGNNIAAATIRITKSSNPLLPSCPDNINSAPQHHFVAKAAMRALNAWIQEGIEPMSFPWLVMNAAKDGFELDEFGNALGGVRSPYTEVPIARMSGLNNAPRQGRRLCFLFGTAEMLDAEVLRSLYSDHASYVAAVTTATYNAINDGTLTPEDAELVIAAAQAANIPPLPEVVSE